MPPKTSLIISTYNQPEFLRLAILSAWEQTQLPDEIVITAVATMNLHVGSMM